jgi:hypothetical protein
MSKSLFQKYIHYQIRKSQNKTRNKHFVNLSDVKHAVILVGAEALTPMQTEQFYQQVYEVSDYCQQRNIQVQIVVCVKKLPVEAKRFNVNVFDYKQVKLFSRRPKQLVIDAFMQHKPEVLINLTPFVSAPLEYLAAMSNAPLKVAIKVAERPFDYDFQLQIADAEQVILHKLQAIFFYLEKIKSK